MRSLTNCSANESTLCEELNGSEIVSSCSQVESNNKEMIAKESEENQTESSRDSGNESDDQFQIPDEELMNKIVSLVESYFADEKLIKDEFLMKHIRRNKEGYVSLKLVASFRKVKVLSKDWRVVAHCIRNGSKTLEINETSTKIRRVNPLPTVDGNKISRTVIAYNLSPNNDTVEQISKLFSSYGDIALIRIFRSGVNVQNYAALNFIFDVSNTTFASIEFNNKSDAEKAVKAMQMNNKNNWRNSVNVILLSKVKNNNNISNENAKRVVKNETPQHYQPKSQYFKQMNQNKSQNYMKFPYGRQKSRSFTEESNRVETAYEKSDQRKVNSNCAQTLKLPNNIIRVPIGPDGTKGFRRQKSHSI